MRQQGGPNNGRRPRGRHQGGGGGNGGGNGGGPRQMGGNSDRPRSASSLRHQTFDSNGPDCRVRGNAWQVHEKYQSLARDAVSSGDRVMAENYQQHAEHYYRIIEAINEATAQEQRARGIAPQPNGNGQNGYSSQPYGSGQQPDIQPGYFPVDSNGLPNGNAIPVAADGAQPEMPQAEVQMRNQPVAQPSPFFTSEEADDNGPEPLVARR